MSIFPRRDDWRELLTLLSEGTLATASLRLQSMVDVLEQKLGQADARHHAALRAVLDDYRVELGEIQAELARRRLPAEGGPGAV